VTDLAAKALDTNQGQYLVGNETFELAGATFVRNADAPGIYDANHVANIRARTRGEIGDLLAAVEREYADSAHRSFHADHRTPPEFVARLLLEPGYKRDDALVMLLEGDLRGTAPQCDIRPQTTDADWDAYYELFLIDWQEDHAKTGRDFREEVARQMLQVKRAKQGTVKYWLAYVGKQAVAYFNSSEGVAGVGQVEDLFTHPDFRNRGIASALIHHCVRESRDAGAGPVVIVADPSDTPKNIYARMGFRPVAVASQYLKRLEE
jgi:GNAT superfamily N-acetyltransferase